MDWVKLHCLIAREASVANVCVCRGRCRYGTFLRAAVGYRD